MSFQDRIIESFIQHAPLIAGLAIAWWWGFPMMFKKSLTNGGGILVGKIVDQANARQTERNRDAIKAALADHEEVEQEKLKLALEVVVAREDGKGRACAATIHAELDAIRARLNRLEAA